MFIEGTYLDRLAARMGGFLLAEGDGGEGGGSPAPAPAPAAPAPVRTTALSAGGEGGGTPAPAPAGDGAPSWPENWRELAAGDDAKALTRLQRMSTPADLFKSYREIEARVSRGQIATLPDDATPEEVTAYRKTLGVPEAPDGYGLAFADGTQVSDADKETLASYAKAAHDLHLPPGQAKALFEWYGKQQAAAVQQRNEAAEDATLKSLADLRGEFKGREYDRHMRITDEFLMQHFGGEPEMLEALNSVLTMRLPNGVPVMYSAPFMKGLFKMAAAHADEEALIGGDIIGSGKSMDDEYQELIRESVTKPSEFHKNAAKVARLDQLAAARVARDERASRRSAA